MCAKVGTYIFIRDNKLEIDVYWTLKAITTFLIAELYWLFYSDPNDRFTPQPVLARFALHHLNCSRMFLILNSFTENFHWLCILSFLNRTPDEVLAAKGVKPTLSPNLNTLALVEVSPILFDASIYINSWWINGW